MGQSWGGGGQGLLGPSSAVPRPGVLSLHPKGVFWEALGQARYPCAPCSPGACSSSMLSITGYPHCSCYPHPAIHTAVPT